METIFYLLIVAFAALSCIVLYLIHINNAFRVTPDEALQISPHRWTVEEIKETYERICKNPIDPTKHLPPNLGRRYIVTGSSGLVGGTIVLQLLARGESPDNIRMLDFREAVWHHKENPKVSQCQYIKTDISSTGSVKTAFLAPWPSSAGAVPLTVFHTAAVIRAHERSKLLYDRCSKVNFDGTANIIAAAKDAGADVLVATSSGSIALRPVEPWIAPWTKYPGNFFQLYDESDAYGPERPHEEHFANYAVSKARAERLVMRANGDKLKTGCIRPASGVYGNEHDHNIATYIPMDEIPTWTPHIFQNFVHADNVSIAHLLYERALLSPEYNEKLGGKTFQVTDPNPAVTFGDTYTLIQALKPTSIRVTALPPVLMLLIAYCIEAYCLTLVRVPFLGRIFTEPNPSEASLSNLQPSIFTICTHVIASDAEARKSLDDGGLGYEGVWTTMEGMCNEMRLWINKYGNGALKNCAKTNTTPVVDGVQKIGAVSSSLKA